MCVDFRTRISRLLWHEVEVEKMQAHMLRHVQLYAALWTVAHQAPLSMGFSRQEYWSGLPFPPPGDPSDPGIKSASLVSTPLADRFFTTVPPGKPMNELLSLRVREIGLRANTPGGREKGAIQSKTNNWRAHACISWTVTGCQLWVRQCSRHLLYISEQRHTDIYFHEAYTFRRVKQTINK